MPRISIDALQPGMKLAKPIVGGNGMTLLGEGTELTERWILRLQEMNLEGVFIEGPSEQAVPLDEALAALEARFSTAQDTAFMGRLKQLLQDHIKSLY